MNYLDEHLGLFFVRAYGSVRRYLVRLTPADWLVLLVVLLVSHYLQWGKKGVVGVFLIALQLLVPIRSYYLAMAAVAVVALAGVAALTRSVALAVTLTNLFFYIAIVSGFTAWSERKRDGSSK